MLTLGNYLTPTLLGGKKLALVHRADLHPVHHALQLGTGRCGSAFLLLVLSTANRGGFGLKLAGQRFGDVMRRT